MQQLSKTKDGFDFGFVVDCGYFGWLRQPFENRDWFEEDFGLVGPVSFVGLWWYCEGYVEDYL